MHNVEIPSIHELLNGQSVESVRLEFKKTWNDVIEAAVVKTVCAFANDLHGRYGGFIVLGVEEASGKPILPPHGLDGLDIDKVQKKIRVACQNRISPEWLPNLSPEKYQGKSIIVLWVPPGEQRPYKARNGGGKGAPFSYFVRIGSETIEAKENSPHYDQLMQLTAKVPFDHIKRHDVKLSDISESLLRRTLFDIRSDLVTPEAIFDTREVLRQMMLSARTNGSDVPRNVALLFFTDAPEQYVPGAFVEMAQFRDDEDLIETRSFRGPLQRQAQTVFEYLDSMVGAMIQKTPGSIQAERFVAFPHDAMREAVVNAIYHRGYDYPPEPIRIGLYPDRMEITSYPGPVPGLQREHLEPGGQPPRLPARNPHIGDLLRRLGLAEAWSTGIPKIRRRMKENGSPDPKFDFDDARTYFRVTLPAHPGYVALHGLREAAALWHSGNRARAVALANDLGHRVPESGTIAALRIDFAADEGDIELARQILSDLENYPGANNIELAITAMERAQNRVNLALAREASAQHGTTVLPQEPADPIARAIFYKSNGRFRDAHHIFSSLVDSIQNDPKALYYYAQTKIQIANSFRPSKDAPSKKPFRQDAASILRRVITLWGDEPPQAALAAFELAQVLHLLEAPSTEIHRVIEQARTLGISDSKLCKQIDVFVQKLVNGGMA